MKKKFVYLKHPQILKVRALIHCVIN